jgi:hypothetical protein
MVWAGTFLLLTALFSGVVPLVRITPSRHINLPNREYWLAEERRPETLAKLASWSEWFGVGINLFFVVAVALTYEATLHEPPRLAEGPFIGVLGLFSVFTLGWVARLLVIFRMPKR